MTHFSTGCRASPKIKFRRYLCRKGGRSEKLCFSDSCPLGQENSKLKGGVPYLETYLGGSGLSGRSSSQKILTTYQRLPSLNSCRLLMPRAKGFSPGALRDS